MRGFRKAHEGPPRQGREGHGRISAEPRRAPLELYRPEGRMGHRPQNKTQARKLQRGHRRTEAGPTDGTQGRGVSRQPARFRRRRRDDAPDPRHVVARPQKRRYKRSCRNQCRRRRPRRREAERGRKEDRPTEQGSHGGFAESFRGRLHGTVDLRRRFWCSSLRNVCAALAASRSKPWHRDNRDARR